jgi:predicted regulator of Ras-like GTPase activity (Roadblock/LC7/MglB family)
VKAAVLLDPDGAVAAHSDAVDEQAAEQLAALSRELAQAAERAAGRLGSDAAAVEVSTGAGTVFLVRERPPEASAEWTLAVVAKRFALASLMLMDMRHVLAGAEAPV